MAERSFSWGGLRVNISWVGPTGDYHGNRLPVVWVAFASPHGGQVDAVGHVLYEPGAELLNGTLTPLEMDQWPAWFQGYLAEASGRTGEVDHEALLVETPLDLWLAILDNARAIYLERLHAYVNELEVTGRLPHGPHCEALYADFLRRSEPPVDVAARLAAFRTAGHLHVLECMAPEYAPSQIAAEVAA